MGLRAFASVIVLGATAMNVAALAAAGCGSELVAAPEDEDDAAAEVGGRGPPDAPSGDAGADGDGDVPTACVVDGEAFAFCESFDGRDAGSGFEPEWSLVREDPDGEAFVRRAPLSSAPSAPNVLFVRTPPLPSPDVAFARAQIEKHFIASGVVLEYSFRIMPPTGGLPAPPHFASLSGVLFVSRPPGTSVSLPVGIWIDSATSARGQSLAVVNVDGGSNLAARAWSGTIGVGVWHGIRRHVRIVAANEVADTVILDGQQVANWRTPVPAGFVVGWTTVHLGVFAANNTDGGPPEWQVAYDDVRLASTP